VAPEFSGRFVRLSFNSIHFLLFAFSFIILLIFVPPTSSSNSLKVLLDTLNFPKWIELTEKNHAEIDDPEFRWENSYTRIFKKQLESFIPKPMLHLSVSFWLVFLDTVGIGFTFKKFTDRVIASILSKIAKTIRDDHIQNYVWKHISKYNISARMREKYPREQANPTWQKIVNNNVEKLKTFANSNTVNTVLGNNFEETTLYTQETTSEHSQDMYFMESDLSDSEKSPLKKPKMESPKQTLAFTSTTTSLFSPNPEVSKFGGDSRSPNTSPAAKPSPTSKSSASAMSSPTFKMSPNPQSTSLHSGKVLGKVSPSHNFGPNESSSRKPWDSFKQNVNPNLLENSSISKEKVKLYLQKT
jgi:hypothetical protein